MEKTDIEKFRKLLTDSRRKLLATAKKSLIEDTKLDPNDLADEIDLASSENAQAMALRLRDREKFLLRKIERAIERLENGEFGICEQCDDEISLRRLEARPVTTLCIRCKEDQERVERSFG